VYLNTVAARRDVVNYFEVSKFELLNMFVIGAKFELFNVFVMGALRVFRRFVVPMVCIAVLRTTSVTRRSLCVSVSLTLCLGQ